MKNNKYLKHIKSENQSTLANFYNIWTKMWRKMRFDQFFNNFLKVKQHYHKWPIQISLVDRHKNQGCMCITWWNGWDPVRALVWEQGM